MKQQIIIDITLKDLIVKHAKKTYPFECCGFLFGYDNEDREITEVMPISNNKKGDQRKRFEIAPLDYLNAEKYAINKDFALLGVYHSHPDHSAKASKYDLDHAVPFFSYIITSIYNSEYHDFKSYQLDLNENKFFEENILITNKQ